MKQKKNFLRILIIPFFFFFFLVFYIFLDPTCFKRSTINAFKSFGYDHVKDFCFKKSNFRSFFLSYDYVNEDSYIINLLRKINLYFKKDYYKNDVNLNQLPTSQQIKDWKNDFSLHKNLPEQKKIKGILNTNKNTLYKPQEKNVLKYEYSSWLRSHGGNWNSKFSNINNINKNNISNLKLKWKYSSIKKENIKNEWKKNSQLNPIFLNGLIIFGTPDYKIAAINVETGKIVWSLQSMCRSGERGILVDNDALTNNNYLYVPTCGKVYKINFNTGEVDKKFGNGGYIISNTKIAPFIDNEKLITVSETISIYNKISGKLIENISIYNKKKNFISTPPWGGASYDIRKKLLFVTTSNPKPPNYGVNRPGSNSSSSALVCVNLKNNKIEWTLQDVSHDLWDLDISAPPVIHDLKIEDKTYEVVITATKSGNLIILERSTGKPLFDLDYKKAPKSSIPGEITSNYQLELLKPMKFSEIEYNSQSYTQLNLKKQKFINDFLKNKGKVGWYETPSLNKDLVLFGLHGGATWNGFALNPYDNHVYIPVDAVPWIIDFHMTSSEIKTSFKDSLNDYHKIYLEKCSSCHGKKRNGVIKVEGRKLTENIPSLVGLSLLDGDLNKLDLENIMSKHENLEVKQSDTQSLKILFKEWDKILKKKYMYKMSGSSGWSMFLTPDDLPASNPPWGYIAKINLENGELKYKLPVGKIKLNDDVVRGLPNNGGLALNKNNIIFFTGALDNFIYAYDAVTKEELWSFKMEAAGTAPPILYNYKGKDYLSVISSGGGPAFWFKNLDSTIYTFEIK